MESRECISWIILLSALSNRIEFKSCRIPSLNNACKYTFKTKGEEIDIEYDFSQKTDCFEELKDVVKLFNFEIVGKKTLKPLDTVNSVYDLISETLNVYFKNEINRARIEMVSRSLFDIGEDSNVLNEEKAVIDTIATFIMLLENTITDNGFTFDGESLKSSFLQHFNKTKADLTRNINEYSIPWIKREKVTIKQKDIEKQRAKLIAYAMMAPNINCGVAIDEILDNNLCFFITSASGLNINRFYLHNRTQQKIDTYEMTHKVYNFILQSNGINSGGLSEDEKESAVLEVIKENPSRKAINYFSNLPEMMAKANIDDMDLIMASALDISQIITEIQAIAGRQRKSTEVNSQYVNNVFSKIYDSVMQDRVLALKTIKYLKKISDGKWSEKDVDDTLKEFSDHLNNNEDKSDKTKE